MENKDDVGKKVDAGKPVDTAENNATVHPVAFLLPTYKTPLLTSNLLHTAHSCGCYADCLFVLLLDSRDPSLLVSKELIDIVHSVVAKDLRPDLTILFDLDPETGLARTEKALADGARSFDESRFEREALEFHRRVRKGYLALAAAERDRFLVIDAGKTPEQVFNAIVSGMNKRLGIDLVESHSDPDTFKMDPGNRG